MDGEVSGGAETSPVLRLPRFDLSEEDMVDRELVVVDGRVAVMLRYRDGLEITLYVENDQVWFEANREWRIDGETGVVSFEQP